MNLKISKISKFSFFPNSKINKIKFYNKKGLNLRFEWNWSIEYQYQYHVFVYPLLNWANFFITWQRTHIPTRKQTMKNIINTIIQAHTLPKSVAVPTAVTTFDHVASLIHEAFAKKAVLAVLWVPILER